MNRKELQELAEERVEGALALIAINKWSTAYYLAGYTVELALKSCILFRIENTGIIFSDKEFVKKLHQSWTHDFEELLRQAGLTQDFSTARTANLVLEKHWQVVKGWQETSRYERKTQADAENLFEAISNEPDGVLRWLRNHW